MNREKKVRLICWIICEVLAVGTVICLLSGGMNEGLLLALATPLILLLPSLAEKLFRCKVSLPIFIFGLVYAMGPMLEAVLCNQLVGQGPAYFRRCYVCTGGLVYLPKTDWGYTKESHHGAICALLFCCACCCLGVYSVRGGSALRNGYAK